MQIKKILRFKIQTTFFKVKNIIYLRLYRKYSVPFIKKKVSQQFVSFFRIIKKIDRLAYRLKLLLIIKIYLIISITYLEPATNPDLNPFYRTRLQIKHLLPIVINSKPEYKIVRLLRKKIYGVAINTLLNT